MVGVNCPNKVAILCVGRGWVFGGCLELDVESTCVLYV
jgi:hypothetical protein